MCFFSFFFGIILLQCSGYKPGSYMREILKTDFIYILCMHSGHDGSSQFIERNCEPDRPTLLRLFISILVLSILRNQNEI